MPRFVQDAEETLIEFARMIARRQAAIARPNAGAEWMHRRVEPASLKIEADRRGRGLPEDMLTINGEFAIEHVLARPFAGVRNRRHEWNEISTQFLENPR